MANYRITIIDEDVNPEFGINEKRLKEGLSMDGYFLIGITRDKDGEPENIISSVMGISVEDLVGVIRDEDNKAGPVIMQAAAIAEGYKKADEIRRRAKSMDVIGSILSSIKND